MDLSEHTAREWLEFIDAKGLPIEIFAKNYESPNRSGIIYPDDPRYETALDIYVDSIQVSYNGVLLIIGITDDTFDDIDE